MTRAQPCDKIPIERTPGTIDPPAESLPVTTKNQLEPIDFLVQIPSTFCDTRRSLFTGAGGAGKGSKIPTRNQLDSGQGTARRFSAKSKGNRRAWGEDPTNLPQPAADPQHHRRRISDIFTLSGGRPGSPAGQSKGAGNPTGKRITRAAVKHKAQRIRQPHYSTMPQPLQYSKRR